MKGNYMKGIDDKPIYIIQLDGKDVLDTNYKINSFKKYKVAFDYSLDLIKNSYANS